MNHACECGHSPDRHEPGFVAGPCEDCSCPFYVWAGDE